MNKNIFISAFVAIVCSGFTFLGLYTYYNTDKELVSEEKLITQAPAAPASPKALFTMDEEGNPVPLSFEEVADKVMDAVVGIQATVNQSTSSRYRQLEDPFEDLFRFFDIEPRQRQSQPDNNQRKAIGSGSGVIINEEGYIVTNNHVIDNASELKVTLHDNREYEATLIGTDPTTDLALIKIDGDNLSKLNLVNSDDVRVGEWVLAVGNPFNLSSTVTAGIVSAKARNINILDDRYAVESFIQTDAAINKGNSGGALINMEGGVIGINSAIFSPSGAYSGYGFAIPSNLVNKVVQDLVEYGTVQRGFLGVSIRDVNNDLAKELNLSEVKGVYVAGLQEGGAADKAGIKEGSVIQKVDGVKVNSTPQLQELIARKRPGDKVNLELLKDNSTYQASVVLENTEGTTDVVKVSEKQNEVLQTLGVSLETIDEKTKAALNIDGGVVVKEIQKDGTIDLYSKIQEGFIITKVDDQIVKDKEEFVKLISRYKNAVMIEGVYPNSSRRYYYALGLAN